MCYVAYAMVMDINERIAQWQKMTEADPSNDMGWFSLGEAYKDAERLAESEAAFGKAVEINPAMTRAIGLRGQVLMKLGRNDEAGVILTEGYKLAAERGDVMPQKAMGSLLTKLGLRLPAVEEAVAGVGSDKGDSGAGGDEIVDRRTGKVGTRMTETPVKGALGDYIAAHYSQETWSEWIGMGTKVINEFRLDFSKVSDQDVFDQQMMMWLGYTAEEVQEYSK